MVDTVSNESVLSKIQLTRREFIKYAGLGSVSLILAYLGLGDIDWEDTAAQISLASEIALDEFSPSRIGRITSLEQLQSKINMGIERLDRLNGSHIMIADSRLDKVLDIRARDVRPTFLAGSVIKVPVCTELCLKDSQAAACFTPQLADSVVGRGDNRAFINFLEQKVPSKKGKPAEQIVREMLFQANIPPQNKKLPVRVKLEDLFDYFRTLDKFPSCLQSALLIGRQPGNYGAAAVSQYNLAGMNNPPPAYFKIGLLDGEIEEGLSQNDRFNSYMFKCGPLTMTGYSRGKDRYSIHKQMLQSIAAASSYVANSGEIMVK